MKRKFMYFWTIILIAVMALTCGFLFACSGGEEDENEVENEVEEEFDPYAIIGVWSNPAIVAETDIYGITEAKAGVELTIEEEEREDEGIGGSLSLAIKGILVEIPNNPLDLDFSSYETEMTGTWEATEDDYVMRLDDNEDVTNDEPLKIRPVRDGNGEVYALALSFAITYSVFEGFLNIPISMNGAMLYAGALE
ncbi:MAG: hypothetical protein LUD47_07305 [Clostridia bacterium]|nr:hypothetical protein [Clostridia bacterium]